MELIDEDGFILGRVNIIDLLVVLFVIAIVIAGLAFITGGTGDADQETRMVDLDAGDVPEHVVDSLEEGPAEPSAVESIDDIRTNADNESAVDLELTVTLVVTEDQDGLPQFADERLYVDRSLELDLGPTILEVTVTDIEAV